MAVVAAVAAAAFIGACDQGSQHDQKTEGPRLRLLGANVGPDKALPSDGKIELAFDRYLLPSTVIRQSFVVTRANGQLAANPAITYDPVARVVTVSSPDPAKAEWLEPGQFYTLTMVLPAGEANTGGVRAVDRAPLEAPISLGFQAVAPANAAALPTTRFCSDVLPLFTSNARCTGSRCHGSGPSAASALVLETSTGVVNTAIGRIAQSSNTAARAGITITNDKHFGVNMPIIDPGNPGNSWLLYKLLLASPLSAAASTPSTRAKCAEGVAGTPPIAPFVVSSAPFTPFASAEERVRLGEFIPGREMPYPSSSELKQPTAEPVDNLTIDELQRIRLWIAQGARVEECGACEP